MKDLKPLFLLFFLIAVLLLGSPTDAQQRRRPQPKPQPRFDQKPFDIAAENLPPNYSGHSVATIYAATRAREVLAKRGEYESTIEYGNRLAQLNRLPLSGPLNSDSILAFEIEPVTQKYSPDLAALDMSLELDSDFDGNVRASWLHRAESTGSYIGRTAFNRAVRVRTARFLDYLFAIRRDQLSNTPFFDQTREGEYSLDGSIAIGPFEAQRLRPRIRALVICQLGPNPVSNFVDHHTPSIDEPYDDLTLKFYVNVILRAVWFYDFPTGRVLTKLEIPQPVSADISTEPTCNPHPSIIFKPTPHYPEEARSNQVVGTVRLSALFKETGEVADIVVIKGLPNGLTESAIEAARGIKFSPAESNGKKVSCRMVLEYTFDLY